MKIGRWLTAALLLVTLITSVSAQKKTTKPPVQKTGAQKATVPKKAPTDKVSEDKNVKDIISFLEYMLNTLGSSGTPIRDKEVLITESYSKIFRDSKVQIEDDLDEERIVVTNKDIVAYLKDVHFFFKNVRFEFTIESVEKSLLPDGGIFYKVSSKRNLIGTNIEGKPINNSLPRFIEINYNPKDDDLKIVSVYTSGIDEKRALTSWWNELSYEWQAIFKKQLGLKDSVSLSDMKTIAAIAELDLSNNTYLQNIVPLGQLSNLRFLNLSGTGIDDLNAIRNLTELVDLNLSNTKIRDLTPLKYSGKLETLNIANSSISNIDILSRMSELKTLEMSGASVSDFTPLNKLTQLTKLNLHGTSLDNVSDIQQLNELTDLNISATSVQDLSSLETLTNITSLNLDSTQVSDLTPLKNLKSLQVLSMNATPVTNLMPLRDLPNLKKIYCDQTQIKRESADAFRNANPNVLLIFDSNDLKSWWETLPPAWRSLLATSAGIGEKPSKEELVLIPLLDSINLSGRSNIRDLEPLRKLVRLKVIRANKTGIQSLQPLQNHKEITFLDISETEVSDIAVINQFKKLTVFKADNSRLKNIAGIENPSLEKVYADNTGTDDISAREFLDRNPHCLLIYKTDRLQQWWQGLSTEWETILKKQMVSPTKVNRENLHALVERESLEIKDAAITNLNQLNEFFRLKKLSVWGTAMASITPLSHLTSLQSLQVTNSPIREIDSLYLLSNLEELDISNTPLEDIYAVWKLKRLKTLNCSGTPIKRMDALEKLENLEHLDCSNTNVTKLNSLDYLPLKTLKCYNTKVSNRAIENFKASHPDCNVMYYR